MIFQKATHALQQARPVWPVGRISGATGGNIFVSGLANAARLGDRVAMLSGDQPVEGEIIRVSPTDLQIMPDGPADGLAVGDMVRLLPSPSFAPDEDWIGRVVDPDGRPLDGRTLVPGLSPRSVRAAPPAPHGRRPLGARLETNLAVFDTLLPLVRGQRIGLFAGSGVGKSTLLGDLARGVTADVIVVGLVGERGRELRHFVKDVLGPNGMERAIVIAATSDRAPQMRRRCAWAATATAEHFRDQGKQVLLLIDSVTRFAEAHRELAAAAGEPAALRGFPATTASAIASLCERTGPGIGVQGDITAVYSVLVAGSDMEEPVADMLRGVLDGHIVLDREIAERGRFPAVDVLRSVSRSLPDAASEPENAMISEARSLMGVYDRAEMMVQAGLYVAGSDPSVDAAIASRDPLERFLSLRRTGSVGASFGLLRQALSAAKPHQGG